MGVDRMGRGRRALLVGTAVLLLAAACAPEPAGPPPPPGPGPEGALPPIPEVPPLRAERVMEGLTLPTNVEVAADGRIFVAEKSGIIRSAAGAGDPAPIVVADLRADVRDIADHGLLGMALDPGYPGRPYLYAYFTTDPTGLWGDTCPEPHPGLGRDGCVGGARIARLTLGGDHRMAGAPLTLTEGRWCYQFSSHGVGDLRFMDDGTLLASSGEGSAWWDADYGQLGGSGGVPPFVTPENPCGDAPVPVGASQDVPTAEGGSLRAQDLLTPGDAVTWDGSLVRIDPDTGAAAPDNPLAGQGSTDDDAVLAHGLRNPFRFAVVPGTDQVVVADVGWSTYEELDRVVVTDDVVENFGWPCREGTVAQRAFAPLDMDLCRLATSPEAPTTLSGPWLQYPHAGQGGSISGVEVIRPGRYPPRYDGDVVFADYVRGGLWSVDVDEDGTPGTPEALAGGLVGVDVQAAPDGYLYVVDIAAGTVERLVPDGGRPRAEVTADRVAGPTPLDVLLDATGSDSPAGWPLSFDWDLDADGQFDDATGGVVSATFDGEGNHTVTVRVSDGVGGSDTATLSVFPGNTAPVVDLEVVAPERWAVGDPISFTASATDAQDGALPAAAVTWRVELHHCATLDICHVHTEFTGPGGDFSFAAPSHEYPAHLEITATAVDSRGQSTTVTRRLDPDTVVLQVRSLPEGAQLTVGGHTGVAPYDLQVIRNSSLTVTGTETATLLGLPFHFSEWNDAGARSHTAVFGADATLVAFYALG